MASKVDDVLIEQHSSRNASGGSMDSRRLLMWAQMDIMAGTEVSTVRRLAAWIALSITFAIALMLLLGY